MPGGGILRPGGGDDIVAGIVVLRIEHDAQPPVENILLDQGGAFDMQTISLPRG